MAREKGMGNLQREKSGRWTMRVGIDGKRYCRSTLEGKRNIWLQFAKWMEHSYLHVEDLAGITPEMIAEYLACIRAEVSATTYNSRVCVLREIFHTLAAKAGLEEDPWEGVRLRPDDSHSRRELTMGELRRLQSAVAAIPAL